MRDCVRTGATLATTGFCSLALFAAPAAASAELTWSAPAAVDPEASGVALNRVACPSTTQCTAVDGQGQEVTFNPQAPQGPTTVLISSHPLTGVACPSTTQCTAVDGQGQEVTFNPQSSTGETATKIDPGAIPLGLVCPSASLCTSVDDTGQAVTFNPQSGQMLASGVVDPGRILVGVDCPGSSTSKCAAVDSSGGAVLFDPQAPASQTPTQRTAYGPAAVAAVYATKAAALHRFQADVGGILKALRKLDPPAVSQPGYEAQIGALEGMRSSAGRLATALVNGPQGYVQRVLAQFDRAATSSQTVPAQKAQIAAIRGYDAQVARLAKLSQAAELERLRLTNTLT